MFTSIWIFNQMDGLTGNDTLKLFWYKQKQPFTDVL